MEFQCRLGTEHGQIVEGVYVADDEVGLRRELEGKGYFILAARPKGAISLPGLPALPTLRRRRVTGQELLLFNQELATLLKAGMPLAQSLDILRQKVPNPTFKGDARRRLREGALRHRAVRRLRRSRLAVPADLHRVAARRREERQPRRDAAPLHRLHARRRHGEAQRALGDHLSGGAVHAVAAVAVRHHDLGGAGVPGLLRHLPAPSCRWRRGP